MMRKFGLKGYRWWLSSELLECITEQKKAVIQKITTKYKMNCGVNF